MGRLTKHLFITTILLTAVTGEDTGLQPRSPDPQILNSLSSTLNSVGGTIGNVTTAVTGGVLGVLNVSLATAADFLTPTLQSMLTVSSLSSISWISANVFKNAPLTVLDNELAAVLHPNSLDPGYHGWQYWGCFNATNYTASHTAKTTNPTLGMSPKLCIALCVADGVEVAAVINNKCYCSNDTPLFNAGSNSCTLACPLNAGLFCGGTATLSVFRRAVTASPGPLPANPEPTGWQYSGCFYGDAWLALAPYVTIYNSSVGLNAATCTTVCATGNNGVSYTYAALYGSRCFCSNSATSLGLQAGVGQCGRSCEVSTIEACGGESIYGWQYYGCYYGALYLLDAIMNGIQVSALLDATPRMSGDRCITLCLAASLSSGVSLDYALTLGGTCFCNSKPPTENLLSPNQTQCNVPCPGNSTQRCGGNDPTRPPTLGGRLVSILGKRPKVSGFLLLLMIVVSMLGTVLCALLVFLWEKTGWRGGGVGCGEGSWSCRGM
ncbi:wsc domain-containing [Pyrenophora seminiperda CCB06]|uniref:Wsc domain-containing n=1 Tax=Pyrenophora seminiperda CCB06 TaxID=1302712 RepID=A0A3M7M1V2_9PLEO|nr:wsc domain-containing [Pyrenophora seminiperda CCB06]